MKTTRLQVERLEERNTPSCSASNFYGEYASSSPPSLIGLNDNAAVAHYYQESGDPAGIGQVNSAFGQYHGCG